MVIKRVIEAVRSEVETATTVVVPLGEGDAVNRHEPVPDAAETVTTAPLAGNGLGMAGFPVLDEVTATPRTWPEELSSSPQVPGGISSDGSWPPFAAEGPLGPWSVPGALSPEPRAG